MWKHINGWDKCRDCWFAYENGVQHVNSLHCYKLGIPISSLNVPVGDFIDKIKDYVAKYGFFPFPVSLLSKGVIILYFNSKEEMMRAIKELQNYVKEPNSREKFFFNTFVNVNWIGGFNYRRGCPEYDKKFGDWRKWPSSTP
ncbi:hypothetical protein [Acidianus sp. HS-5]|uniref:hypothetical protein n=1 Tax=Acidianus sp. HS-5 TaxID=2886040 RepID=UPI001F1CB94B|nr:hypothetical protein [Acidianus sp. HS-5]BDC17617.1 hypothetical protein HS5_05070 [Acidianus sp. HS-5]